jgi:hypothetical protein
MSDNDDRSLEDVGYGKPPKHTRFRKGTSGNPRGRTKGISNWATILKRTLQEKTIINDKGVRKTVPKIEAIFKRLGDKAASGDLQAARQVTPLYITAEAETAPGLNKSSFSDTDKKIMKRLLERLLNLKTGRTNDNND